MSRVSSFLLGIVFGAAALYGAMHYHVVHSADGFHLIARLSPTLGNPYVDVRKFTAVDWQKNHELAMASLRASKGKLIQEPAAAVPSSISQTGGQTSVRITDSASLANW
jgi:hypothetical protein